MIAAQHGDLRAVIQGARRIVEDLSALVASMEELAAQQDQLRARCERLDWEREELRETNESARREREEAARALVELRSAYEALRTEYEASRQPSRKRKVMVVDDAHSDLTMMESILKSAGHQVVPCRDGDQLEEKVALERPDVLLLDILLPNRNGYELLRALKKDERTKHTPVVIVTARNHESDRVWSKRQGADEYVTKPFMPEQLLAVVQKLVG